MILTYNIWTFICKKKSKTWPLLVFVSLKYCAEKRLLKTHVAFFYESNCITVRAVKAMYECNGSCIFLEQMCRKTSNNSRSNDNLLSHYDTLRWAPIIVNYILKQVCICIHFDSAPLSLPSKFLNISAKFRQLRNEQHISEYM
jgi:hypothetical protein